MKPNPSSLKRSHLRAAFLVCFGAMIGCPFTALAQPAEFAFTPTNSSGTFYGQATVNGYPANPNDWIAAFDLNGNCAGAAPMVMNDGTAFVNLAIYGDDMTTSTVDEGITNGESFTLNLWRAATGEILTYPGWDAIQLFDGWSNTNGAPMPGFDDPYIVYNFEEIAQPPSIDGPSETCLNAEPFALSTAPSGGVLVGTGIVDGLFDPMAAGEGTHTIDYIVDGVIASLAITVTPELDATILTEGPFCGNILEVTLEAVTSGGTWSGNGVFDNIFAPYFVPPGTTVITHELGEPGDACYDSDQVAIVVFPAPSEPTADVVEVTSGVYNVEVETQPNVTYEWFDLDGNFLTAGDVFPNYDGSEVVLVATNAYGCAESTVLQIALSISEPEALRIRWIDSQTLQAFMPAKRASLWDAQGRLLHSQDLNGTTSFTLPLTEGDGWRLVVVQFEDGSIVRSPIVR